MYPHYISNDNEKVSIALVNMVRKAKIFNDTSSVYRICINVKPDIICYLYNSLRTDPYKCFHPGAVPRLTRNLRSCNIRGLVYLDMQMRGAIITTAI
jgi:hypothetical protein